MSVLGGPLGNVLRRQMGLSSAGGLGGGTPDPSYSVSGPSTGVALAESTNFTVTGYNLTGPVVVTPASDDPGGTFDPATVTIDVGDLVKTFTYTPDGSVGTHTISFTNDDGLSDPASLEYEVTAPAYETEYQAILDRATTLGYTLPSTGQRTKQNTLLAALKTAGIWTKLDIFYLFCNDGSKEFATLNWKAPSSYQITLVNSPIFSSNQGIAGDAVSAYMDLGFNCSTNGVQYTQNNASRFAWVYSAVASAPIDGVSGVNSNRMLSSSSNAHRINQGAAGTLDTAADLSGTGLRQINRTSSTNVELFVGTTQISRTCTSAAMANAAQFLLRTNASYGANSLSAYGLGASLVSENSDLNTALNTYISAP